MENKNILTLRKCAYLYSSITPTMNSEWIKNVRKYLDQVYQNNDTKNQHEYMHINDKIFIELYSHYYQLNDIQIAHINGDYSNSTINYRKIILADDVVKYTPNFHVFAKSLYHNTIKSLNCEFFTEDDDIGFIRIYFDRSSVRFTVDRRDNSCYTSGEYNRYKKIDWDALPSDLYMNSEEAIRAFYELKTAICGCEGN